MESNARLGNRVGVQDGKAGLPGTENKKECIYIHELSLTEKTHITACLLNTHI